MRFGAVTTVTLLLVSGFVAFTPGCNLIETRDARGSGGSLTTPPSSSGGVQSGGGTASSGGVTSSGGITTSSGGNSSGSSSSGGAGASGGVTSSGGTSPLGGSGGTAGSGGAGGAGGSGGKTASGGVTSSGGTSARGGSSGTAASGGTIGSGGTTTSVISTSTCTDDPPPDQTPTCSEWNSYGMCSQSWFATYCNRTCGRCSGSGSGGIPSSGGSSARGGAGSSGGVTGTGGTTARGGAGGVVSPGTTNPQITGTNGWASRYWDCCKPSCGWTANCNPPVPSCDKGGTTRIASDAKNGCEGGGSAFECYDFSPWYESGANMAYGFAAYNGVACGTCFELQFTGGSNSGNNPGAAALKGQQMIVQVINIGGIAANQFDLLIPGGGVGAMSAGCTAQWGNVDLGVTYGGLLSECAGDCTCMKGKCSSVFGSISLLKAGCDWFTGWFNCADNPQLVYKQVSCPTQLTSKTGVAK